MKAAHEKFNKIKNKELAWIYLCFIYTENVDCVYQIEDIPLEIRKFIKMIIAEHFVSEDSFCETHPCE